jgi:hypothetical protein
MMFYAMKDPYIFFHTCSLFLTPPLPPHLQFNTVNGERTYTIDNGDIDKCFSQAEEDKDRDEGEDE